MPSYLWIIFPSILGAVAGILLVYYSYSVFKRKASKKGKQNNHRLELIRWFLIALLLTLAFLFFILPSDRRM